QFVLILRHLQKSRRPGIRSPGISDFLRSVVMSLSGLAPDLFRARVALEAQIYGRIICDRLCGVDDNVSGLRVGAFIFEAFEQGIKVSCYVILVKMEVKVLLDISDGIG